jgi:GNAT superfamily N-acetyltransferase
LPSSHRTSSISRLLAALLNFYVLPEYRGAGLARRLLAVAVEEGRRLGLRVITLHASKFGRKLYEQNGFRSNNEMILLSDGSTEPTS